MTVSQRYGVLDVTTPAGTAIGDPLTTPLVLGDVRLDRIDCRIPPGPSGLVGVSIQQTGTQIWPWGVLGTWIVGDDESFQVPIGTEIDSGITVVSYNLDTFDHTIYFKFLYTPMALLPSSVIAVPIVAVS